jgi:hypothetical protein
VHFGSGRTAASVVAFRVLVPCRTVASGRMREGWRSTYTSNATSASSVFACARDRAGCLFGLACSCLLLILEGGLAVQAQIFRTGECALG